MKEAHTMPESYSPAYLVDHLARRTSCPPRRVWLILCEHYPWITPTAYGPDPNGFSITQAEAAQIEKILWEELDKDLMLEYEPDFRPLPRPIEQRVFTPALATTIPQNYSRDHHKI